ncbi:hypothetical protein B0A54_17675 [Friedmanniomyces endolithicus]|uniref:AB hydrolase-1 domain-containing protein n=1 Tax=Friedmanniomyces endolithicus TaxID=329885 RepID=A0A4U0TSL2_9PEZI|nr:hypothetical protein B0A54_17675 [Friedmanniomyces endolithicus]
MDGLREKHLDTRRGLHYRYYASPTSNPSKPALLLLHGWPDSALLWQYVVPHLTSLNLTLIIPDLLGYGGTSKPLFPALYDYRLLSADLVEILDAESVETVIPIGHDFGCWLVFKFQTLHPFRCAAAVHIGIAYMPPMPVMPDLETLNAMMEQQLGYPRYTYFHLFTSPDAPAHFSQQMESVWHVMHGEGKDWIKHIFCTPNAMREFIEAGRTDVPLRSYAQNAKLKDEWKEQRPSPEDWEASFCWYNAFALGIQAEADASIPVEDYRLRIPVLAIFCTEDGVNPPETLEGPKQAGLLPDLKEERLGFCQRTREDPESELRLFTTQILSLFFHFLLEQSRGTLRHASTLQTYWDTLCLVRKEETGLYVVEPHVKDAVVGVRQQLAYESKLESEKQAKPIVRAEDESSAATPVVTLFVRAALPE